MQWFHFGLPCFGEICSAMLPAVPIRLQQPHNESSRRWHANSCSACIFILNCLMCYYNMLSNFDKNASYCKEIETYWSEILFQSFCWGQCNSVISFEFCCSLVKLCLFLTWEFLIWCGPTVHWLCQKSQEDRNGLFQFPKLEGPYAGLIYGRP